MKIESVEIRFERFTDSGRHDMEGVHHVKSLPWLSVVQSLEGSYDIAIDNGAILQTGAGGFFVAASQVTQHITHHNDPNTNKMRNRWIFLEVTVNQKYRLEHLFDFPTLLPHEHRDEMNALFDDLFANRDDPCERMSLCYRIVKLLIAIGTPKEEICNGALLKVIEYLHAHYKEPLTVTDLATVSYLSESYLYSCFKRQFGTSPIAYLNHYRLTVASDLLKETTLSITQISEAVGFSDPLYFSRLFQRVFHVSPRAYRQNSF